MSEGSGGSKPGFWGWFSLVFVGAGVVVAVWEWLAAHREVVERIKLVVWCVAMLVLLGFVVWGWWSRRSGGAGVRGLSGGWTRADRAVFSLVPLVGGGGSQAGSGLASLEQRRRRGVSAEVEYWRLVLARAGGVVRVMWTVDDGGLVFGVSVPGEVGGSARRAAGSAWRSVGVEEWPVAGGVGVSDGVPVDEVGGGAVVRCYLVPEVLSRPLLTPSRHLDHPLASVLDVLEGHRGVDVELRIDLVPVSAEVRDRVCSERLEGLGEWDPDRELWETDEKRGLVAGVRVLLRVARAGAGHAEECVEVAEGICGVLGSLWSADRNRLVVGEVSDGVFDQIWDTGAVERDVPVWYWPFLEALLGPPPAGLGRTAETGRLSAPSGLGTFDPRSL